MGHGRKRHYPDVQQVAVAVLSVLCPVHNDARVVDQPDGQVRAGHRQPEALPEIRDRRPQVLR